MCPLLRLLHYPNWVFVRQFNESIMDIFRRLPIDFIYRVGVRLA